MRDRVVMGRTVGQGCTGQDSVRGCEGHCCRSGSDGGMRKAVIDRVAMDRAVAGCSQRRGSPVFAAAAALVTLLLWISCKCPGKER